MNPLTNMKNVIKLSEQELYTGNKTSWHDQYRDSAWVFIGGLPFDLTEGDIICIFSQYGEIVNINLIREKDSGKSKGFCFLCYEDQRSTDLAVDNLNGIKILNRTIRVDHVSNYKVPKQGKKTDAETKRLYEEGCAPKAVPVSQPPVLLKPMKFKSDPDDFRETLADCIKPEINLPQRLPIYVIKEEKISDDESSKKTKKVKKLKKEKKHKSKKKSKKDNSDSSFNDDSDKAKKKKKSRKRNKSESSESSSENSDKEPKREPEIGGKRMRKEPQDPERFYRRSSRSRERENLRENYRNPERRHR